MLEKFEEFDIPNNEFFVTKPNLCTNVEELATIQLSQGPPSGMDDDVMTAKKAEYHGVLKRHFEGLTSGIICPFMISKVIIDGVVKYKLMCTQTFPKLKLLRWHMICHFEDVDDREGLSQCKYCTFVALLNITGQHQTDQHKNVTPEMQSLYLKNTDTPWFVAEDIVEIFKRNASKRMMTSFNRVLELYREMKALKDAGLHIVDGIAHKLFERQSQADGAARVYDSNKHRKSKKKARSDHSNSLSSVSDDSIEEEEIDED